MVREMSTKEVALFLDISERRVQQLTVEKVIEKIGSGKYDIRDTAHKYYKFKYDSGTAESLDKEKAKHEEVKRRLAEIKLQKAQKEVYSADVVEAVMTEMAVTCRNKFLSLPQKLAPQLIGHKNINVISGILDNEIRSALEELSDYDPQLFIEECGDDEEEETFIPEDS